VENYLFQYKSVNRTKTYSVSKENFMIIYVEVSENEKDVDGFWLKLRHGLNELKGELPSGVASLTADNDFGSTSAILLAVQSETKTYKELENYIKSFEDDVRKVPSVSKVKHYGLQKEQISIYMDDAKLANYGIKPIQVFAALKPQSTVNYAGEIDDGKYVHPIHISSNFKTEQDVANQIVYSDPQGNVVRVKDIAKVVREYDDMDSYIRVNGKKCLLVSLEMKSGENVVHFGTAVQKAIDKFFCFPPAGRKNHHDFQYSRSCIESYCKLSQRICGRDDSGNTGNDPAASIESRPNCSDCNSNFYFNGDWNYVGKWNGSANRFACRLNYCPRYNRG